MGQHVWSTANSVGTWTLAALYAVPVMIVLVPFYRPGVRDFFVLLVVAVLFMWIVVTLAAAFYEALVHQPEKRRREREEAAALAAAEAKRAAQARADAEARQRSKFREEALVARHYLREATLAQVRQTEAQLLQAFAAYRVQVDFGGDMARADLVNGFARRVAAGSLPDMVHLFRSASPDVRAILDAMLALPGFPVHVVPVTFRDGRTFAVPCRTLAEADQMRRRHRGALPPPPVVAAHPREQDWRERCRVRRASIEEEVGCAFAELAVEFPDPWHGGREEAMAREKEFYRVAAFELLASPIPDMGLLRESGSLVTRAIVAAGAAWPPSPLHLPEGHRSLSDGNGLW